MPGEAGRTNNIVLEALLFEGGLLLLAMGLAWLVGHSLLGQVKFRLQAFGLAAVATLPLLLALSWATHSRWRLFKQLMREIDDKVLPLFASCSVLDLAAISVLAGVAEESFFRGILQSALADPLGAPLALAVASVVFGLVHFITPAYAVIASLIGLYLGGLLMITDNLLVPILSHAIYDFVALVCLVRTK